MSCHLSSLTCADFQQKSYLFHLLLNHTVVSSILIHLFIMSSTSKAMASVEVLSSRLIAAILHPSLTRFVNLNEMRCHVFYLNMLCSMSWFHAVPSFMAPMTIWDGSSLWDTVINSIIPYELLLSYAYEACSIGWVQMRIFIWLWARNFSFLIKMTCKLNK